MCATAHALALNPTPENMHPYFTVSPVSGLIIQACQVHRLPRHVDCLFGSAAADLHQRISDLNVLCHVMYDADALLFGELISCECVLWTTKTWHFILLCSQTYTTLYQLKFI